MVRLPLLPLVLAACVGCTISREYDGQQLGPEQLEALANVETKAEVLEQVGPPEDMGLLQDGSVFIYRFRREALENLNLQFFRATFDYESTDRRTDRLVVLFDKRGQVTGYGLDWATQAED
jgi:outer membrane protein assembly factor BamE (lipoprotein component of BamABCDE complex)